MAAIERAERRRLSPRLRRTGCCAAALAVAALAVIATLGGPRNRVHPEVGDADPALLFREALAALERGDLDAASENLRSLGGRPAFDSHRRLLRGAILLRRGHSREAIEDLRELEPKGELRTPGYLYAGECLYELGRLTEAESCFLTLTTEQPDLAAAWRWLAVVYYDLGAPDRAETCLRRLIELTPHDFRPYRMLGTIHKDFRSYTEAAAEFRTALECRPPNDLARSITKDLAACLMSDHRFAEAIKALDELQEERDAETWALRSECSWSLGRARESSEALARAVAMDPSAAAVLRWQGLSLVNAGRFEESIGVFRQALAIDSHNVECRYQLALAYQRLGRESEYDAEMKIMERSKSLLERISDLTGQAMERPFDPDIRDRMAETCDALGRHELAATWRRAAEMLRRRTPPPHSRFVN